jgi:uncharacterized surface protein with fasciclin (FAS1) repeats
MNLTHPFPLRASLSAFLLTVFFAPSSLTASEKCLGSFESEESIKAWMSVNDSVMGGISKGGFTRSKEGTLVFSGELSLENNGGFSSIRMKSPAIDLTGTAALVVKARGDGRTYWLDLRTKDQMPASSYRAYLPTTAGEWKEIRVPLEDFKLQAYGQELPLKSLDRTATVGLGFTLADKKAGPFEMEIASIKTAAKADPAAEPAGPQNIVGLAKAAGGFKTLLAALTAAELDGALAGAGPFTVFAPTDEAFAKLPAGTVDTLLKPENRPQLEEILKYHVIPASVPLAKALELREGTTLQGSNVAIRFEEGRVRVGEASLLKADLAASNGIIHVIDQVLIPAKAIAEPLGPAGLIKLAISKGVPLFNHGDAAGCAAVYEVTCEALLTMVSIPEAPRKDLTTTLREARAQTSDSQRAWILRGAIDRTWTALEAQ